MNGSVAGTSAYNNLSDARLKRNVRPVESALDIVTKLRGVRFFWRTPQERTVRRNLTLPSKSPQIGFVAQEVKSVLPEAVTTAGGKDAIMSIQERKVVPVLVEAVKELKSLNDRQAERISELEHKVGQLGNERTAANHSIVHRLVLALGF